MGFRVLLTTHYLIREILVEAVLDIHVRGVKIKRFLDPNVITMHLLQKKVHEEIVVLVCTPRTIYSLRDYDRKDSWVKF